MTDDEKALIQKDLDEQKKAFELLRAVRELEAWRRIDPNNRYWSMEGRSDDPHAHCVEYFGDTPKQMIVDTNDPGDAIIALAARVREGE